jgi:hypothetical protein
MPAKWIVVDPNWSKPDTKPEVVKNEDKDTPMLPMDPNTKEVKALPKGVEKVAKENNMIPE